LINIDATDAGSAEMSLKKPDFAIPFAIDNPTKIFNFDVSKSDEKFAILFLGPPRSSLGRGAGESGEPPYPAYYGGGLPPRPKHTVLLAYHDVYD
jgi:hypothetical protein